MRRTASLRCWGVFAFIGAVGAVGALLCRRFYKRLGASEDARKTARKLLRNRTGLFPGGTAARRVVCVRAAWWGGSKLVEEGGDLVLRSQLL